jgi:hypothetical protein
VLPWRSRLARRVAIGAAASRPLVFFVAASVSAAVATATIGVVAHDVGAARAWGWASVGLGELVVASTAVAVRQWRFAPRPRLVGLVVVIVVALGLVTFVPRLVADGSWFAPLSVFATLTLASSMLRRARPPTVLESVRHDRLADR